MELQPACREKVARLIDKGVRIPNPLTLDIGHEVSVDRISGESVAIYPGCRIYGEKTVVSAGARIGYEGPVTIDNCRIGPKVDLKGGYFSNSVFLEGANMGLGAQVREACILEEEASGAHCVGLKQTILFPFVTLGSLINFCDCLMAGGTSRQNHSEVGSSYIHFNFTPDGDKTTPSLIGDVPRGVMLREASIFLGGQGGIVGPLRMGYGNVVAAGSILRKDYPEENKLIVGKASVGGVRGFVPQTYAGFSHIVEKNILYLANLTALEEWYRWVRKDFLESQEFGSLIYEGLMDAVSSAKRERLKRLKTMAEKAQASASSRAGERHAGAKRDLHENMGLVEDIFMGKAAEERTKMRRERFLADFNRLTGAMTTGYIQAIQALSTDARAAGVQWLDQIVNTLCGKVAGALPSLRLFGE